MATAVGDAGGTGAGEHAGPELDSGVCEREHRKHDEAGDGMQQLLEVLGGRDAFAGDDGHLVDLCRGGFFRKVLRPPLGGVGGREPMRGGGEGEGDAGDGGVHAGAVCGVPGGDRERDVDR